MGQRDTLTGKGGCTIINHGIPDHSFYMPTRIIYGQGTLSRLPDAVEETAGPDAHVFLVTGPNNLKSQGTLDRVLDDLGRFRLIHYGGALPFTPPHLVDDAVEARRASEATVVVGIGGGSVLDLAKLVAILASNPGPSLDYGTGARRVGPPGLPFIAVPTTSGSSSEVTSAARLWLFDQQESYAISHRNMYPAVAIVDPDLALTMPSELAAATGMDAFSSAFESYWATESQPITDALALRVIRLYAQNLEASCKGAAEESRANCALAATISGVGYTNSHPNVCHAFSQPLTLMRGVVHGQAVGVSLGACLKWNAPAISYKLPALWEALGVEGLDDAVTRVEQIMESCGLKTRLGDLGFGTDDMETALDLVPWYRLKIMPREMSRLQAHSLLESLL